MTPWTPSPCQRRRSRTTSSTEPKRKLCARHSASCSGTRGNHSRPRARRAATLGARAARSRWAPSATAGSWPRPGRRRGSGRRGTSSFRGYSSKVTRVAFHLVGELGGDAHRPLHRRGPRRSGRPPVGEREALRLVQRPRAAARRDRGPAPQRAGSPRRAGLEAGPCARVSGGNGMPNIRCSISFQPAPMPRSNRPPASWSMAARSLARMRRLVERQGRDDRAEADPPGGASPAHGQRGPGLERGPRRVAEESGQVIRTDRARRIRRPRPRARGAASAPG